MEIGDFIRPQTNGVSRRLPTPTGVGSDKFRVIDALADDGLRRVANEVKTGDGLLDNRIRAQIRKDKFLLDRGDVDEVVWHFFPSARGSRLGPEQALLEELKAPT